MKLVLLVVSVVSVFTADYGDFPDEPHKRSNSAKMDEDQNFPVEQERIERNELELRGNSKMKLRKCQSKLDSCKAIQGSQCTSDMVLVGSKYYKIFKTTEYSWEGAKQKCTREGLIMAEPRDNSLAVYLRTLDGRRFWLGAKGNGRAFAWNSGDVLSSSSSLWYPGHPENRFKYCLQSCRTNCAHRAYYALSCSTKRYAVCQCRRS